ncbi:MAG: hypothetical protein JST93_18130 [Acidobacteria bacterium]|nr:hypothetical protein [Acidobacteriota bacterium]
MPPRSITELLEEEEGPFRPPTSFPFKPSVPEERIAAVVARVHAQSLAENDTLKKGVSPKE